MCCGCQYVYEIENRFSSIPEDFSFSETDFGLNSNYLGSPIDGPACVSDLSRPLVDPVSELCGVVSRDGLGDYVTQGLDHLFLNLQKPLLNLLGRVL